jgi:C4-dicarboxylate-binding protein DctP
MKEATDYANQIADEENAKALAGIKAAGTTEVHDLTAEELAAWRKALIPVHQEVADRVGPDLIQAIYKATNFQPSN